jgi:hypothetical protein
MAGAGILHLAARTVGWVGKFRHKQVGNFPHGFAAIKP